MKINKESIYFYARFTDGSTVTDESENLFEQKYQEHIEKGKTPYRKESFSYLTIHDPVYEYIMHVRDLLNQKNFFKIKQYNQDKEKVINAQIN